MTRTDPTNAQWRSTAPSASEPSAPEPSGPDAWLGRLPKSPALPDQTTQHDHPLVPAQLGTKGTKGTTGSCTLVGAGPGDPEMLTIKAARAIAQATVLLVDDLVSDDIVALATPGARVVHVGKRGGCQSTPQAFIEKLMIQAVQAGERVVRLKGGDPFVFGRGGEEVEHLQAAGIAVTVVNGITAGLAAVTSLGVPLTHREHAHGVVFVTGHAKPGSTGPDWITLARTCHQAKLTLVIYMGVSGAAHIQAKLSSELPASTPVAIVQHASLPQQRHAVCELQYLHATLQAAQLGSPSVIVVGDVIEGLLALHQQASTDQRKMA